jgi:putative flippase GtrA
VLKKINEYGGSLLSRQARQRLVRFAFVGVGATLIHFFVAVALVSGLRVTPALANPAGVVVATLFSYFVNTRWSFEARLGMKTLFRFVIVSTLIALVASAMSGLFGALQLDYRFGILATVLVIPPVTFFMHHRWTYRVD